MDFGWKEVIWAIVLVMVCSLECADPATIKAKHKHRPTTGQQHQQAPGKAPRSGP